MGFELGKRAEEAGEVFGDLVGEGGEREVAEAGEAGVDGAEVGGMVDRVAVGEAGECVRAVRGGRRHRGGVGFDEEAVEGERAEDVEAPRRARGNVIHYMTLCGEGGRKEVAVEGEIGAEVGEVSREFGGAGVGVEEEAARGELGVTEDIGEGAPGIDAVDRDGQVALGGEGKLPDERVALFVEWRATKAGEAGIVGTGAFEHPAIEADFADEGVRVGVEDAEEVCSPVGRGVADVPRMEAVAGEQEGFWVLGLGF